MLSSIQSLTVLGNIRVFCRVRPKIKEDGGGPMANDIVDYDRDDDGLIYVTNKTRTQTFEVDKVFTQTSLQEEVNSFVLELRSWRGLLDTTLCTTGRRSSPGTLVSSTNKTDRHDITEILLKVALFYLACFKQLLGFFLQYLHITFFCLSP